MPNWLVRFWSRRDGVSAVEFALFLPIFLTMMVSMLEAGRVLYQASAVEKGIRAGALYAARAPLPLSDADATIARNIARTGSRDGTDPYLVSGWGETGSSLSITSRDFPVGDSTIKVYRLSASVAYDPLLPGLMSVLGFDGYMIEFAHEQAYIGL